MNLCKTDKNSGGDGCGTKRAGERLRFGNKIDRIVRRADCSESEGRTPALHTDERVLHWLRNLLCGALIGAGGILPGVSGGVLAVVFDIYQPFMEVLTHPRLALPKYGKWIPPLAIGCVAGFLGFARGISTALELSAAATTWLFIGLIAGTMPSLFREAGKEGRSPGAWAATAVCFSAMFFSLFYIGRVAGIHVEPNFWWYSFCGWLWGMSVIVPGMTSSSILMALDL